MRRCNRGTVDAVGRPHCIPAPCILHPSVAHSWYMSIVGGDVWGASGDSCSRGPCVRRGIDAQDRRYPGLGGAHGYARLNTFISHPFHRSLVKPTREHLQCSLIPTLWYLYVACGVISGQPPRGSSLPAISIIPFTLLAFVGEVCVLRPAMVLTPVASYMASPVLA
jgi:hypothetical protein